MELVEEETTVDVDDPTDSTDVVEEEAPVDAEDSTVSTDVVEEAPADVEDPAGSVGVVEGEADVATVEEAIRYRWLAFLFSSPRWIHDLRRALWLHGPATACSAAKRPMARENKTLDRILLE